jgi:hypothetical protein
MQLHRYATSITMYFITVLGLEYGEGVSFVLHQVHCPGHAANHARTSADCARKMKEIVCSKLTKPLKECAGGTPSYQTGPGLAGGVGLQRWRRVQPRASRLPRRTYPTLVRRTYPHKI